MRVTQPTTSAEHGHRLADVERTQVVVIGGGINGIATFRDLALQRIDVVLVERGDFSGGASAASSHMVHGGLRYLENGEARLVQESVQERNSLLYTAPHRVTPLPTTIPLRRAWAGLLAAPLKVLRHGAGKGPSERGAVLAKLGLTMYDAYSGRTGRLPRHSFTGPAATRELFPDMADDIRYTATYHDASVGEPERVAIDMVLDGTAAHAGARAASQMEAIALNETGLVVRDRETQTTHAIRADVVVNASGPWTDLTNESLGHPTAHMGGTKGSHIVVDHPELLAATRGHEIFFEHPDGRIVLIYPLHGRVLIGTTDLPADPREKAICTEEEVDYFLELVSHVFPGIDVAREHIVYRYAGIRPLPRAEDTAPGVVSRDYRLEERDDHGRLVISIVGGKWTTFRALGARVTDRVLDRLGAARRIHTGREQIGGGKRYPRTPAEREAWMQSRLEAADPHRAEVLFARYGTRAQHVHDFIRAGEDSPIAGYQLSTREVEYLVREEFALHVSDVVQRRTTLAFTGQVTREVIEQIAAAMSAPAGWDVSTRDEEVRRCVDDLRSAHHVHLEAA